MDSTLIFALGLVAGVFITFLLFFNLGVQVKNNHPEVYEALYKAEHPDE